MESFLNRLAKLDHLTRSETKIADFLQRNYPDIAFENTMSISQKVGVSKATVVRFITKLGYQDFSDFRDGLHQEVRTRLDKPIDRYPLKKKEILDAGADILEKSARIAFRTIQECHSRNSPEIFLEIAKILALSPGSLYLVASLSTFGLAHLFWYYANYIRDGVHLLDNQAGSVANQLFHVKPDDVLFVISHRRYSRLTYQTVESFSRRGGRIVLLVDGEVNPYTNFRPKTLIAPVDSISMFDSSAAFLMIIESLLAVMTHLLEKDLAERFNVADTLFREFETFLPGPLSDRKKMPDDPRD